MGLETRVFYKPEDGSFILDVLSMICSTIRSVKAFLSGDILLIDYLKTVGQPIRTRSL